jgi:hypothetical protein
LKSHSAAAISSKDSGLTCPKIRIGIKNIISKLLITLPEYYFNIWQSKKLIYEIKELKLVNIQSCI